jgi:hypothetical protein
VPDSLHINAYPFISALNIHDLANHESPAKRLIKDRSSLDDLTNCHAEGRGFESLQPLPIAEPKAPPSGRRFSFRVNAQVNSLQARCR